MLVMSKGAISAVQAETYYEEKYVHDDYYSEEQRVVGEWFGRGAEVLGLSGEVASEDFRAVLRGQRPSNEEVLVHIANGRTGATPFRWTVLGLRLDFLFAGSFRS
jgi:hypothetical protein